MSSSVFELEVSINYSSGICFGPKADDGSLQFGKNGIDIRLADVSVNDPVDGSSFTHTVIGCPYLKGSTCGRAELVRPSRFTVRRRIEPSCVYAFGYGRVLNSGPRGHFDRPRELINKALSGTPYLSRPRRRV